jgi:hypothetical protein
MSHRIVVSALSLLLWWAMRFSKGGHTEVPRWLQHVSRSSDFHVSTYPSGHLIVNALRVSNVASGCDPCVVLTFIVLKSLVLGFGE